ncbi:MAG: HAMP domain-containing protein [Burkholderiaceae bacterium]
MNGRPESGDLTPLRARESLRAKGWFATLALFAYVLASAAYVSLERAKLDDSVQTLQRLSRHEKALALAEATVNGAVLDVSLVSQAATIEPSMPAEIAQYMLVCAKAFAELDAFDSGYAALWRDIANSHVGIQAAPLRTAWVELSQALTAAAQDLEARRGRLGERRDELTRDYQRHYDSITKKSLLLSLAGITGFGALAAWFFARLTRDIGNLEAHARRIVRGQRGTLLPVARADEVGHLMHAVNRMATDLDERENRIELDEHRRAHQDKMLAVAALAAGVAHEVNNPLAVIAGVAEDLASQRGDVPAQRIAEAAQLILAQTRRATHAARNLADVAASQPTEFDWVDVNAMLRRVAQWLGYDKRYRHVEFEFDLGADIPALRVPGATLQQVLMQLMTLGCEAMLPDAPHTVRVSTRLDAGAVRTQLEFPARIDPSDLRAARSVLLSRAMIEPLRGRLELSQDAGPLLRFQLTWPIDPGGANQG